MSDVAALSPLPPLYQRWLEDALGGAIPNEPRSTCNDCAMQPSGGASGDPPPVAFRADTKCCTFQPELHNFLVGAILAAADTGDRGVAWANEMLALRLVKRVGVSPLGVRADAFGGLLYDRIVEAVPSSFGRLPEVRCPYYIQRGGLCGVWQHRNAICSTWFCKYTRGDVGLAFWKATLGLLRTVERAVSMWCVLQLDPGAEALSLLLFLDQRRDSAVRDLVEGVPDHTFRTLWGTWAGREGAFYRECAKLAATLAWADIVRIAGPELGVFEGIVKRQFELLTSPALPAALERGTEPVFQIHPTKPAHYRAVVHRLGYDPLDLPAEVLPLLVELCGKEPRVALAELHASGRGAVLDEALLRRLIDYGVLVPARTAP